MSNGKAASKFSGIFENARGREVDGLEHTDVLEASAPEAAPVHARRPPTTKAAKPTKPNGQAGRPAGKRSDPEYTQVTAYIRTGTHKETKIALLNEGRDREFSELVQDLLQKWLQAHR